MVVVGNKVTDSWRRYVEEGIGDPCLFLLLPAYLTLVNKEVFIRGL